jgi:hypothetical protein
MMRSTAEILSDYRPIPGADRVNGVTFDGQHVWFAPGDRLNALDPASGKTQRSIDAAAHAGTTFNGQHLFQIGEDRIRKTDPNSRRVLATIPAPAMRHRPAITTVAAWIFALVLSVLSSPRPDVPPPAPIVPM